MAKRALDIFLSFAGILIAIPLFIFIGLCIKIIDGGEIFYKQKRVGLMGSSFTAYKFKTMKGERVTRLGKILRATAMDELPQLFNIFKGDMSFVGPRALAEDEYDVVEGKKINIRQLDGFEKRCSVKPGLTGIAQVYAPRDIPLRNKFKYDLLYIKKKSFCLDIRLILISFLVTFFGRWEKKKRLPEVLVKILRLRKNSPRS